LISHPNQARRAQRQARSIGHDGKPSFRFLTPSLAHRAKATPLGDACRLVRVPW